MILLQKQLKRCAEGIILRISKECDTQDGFLFRNSDRVLHGGIRNNNRKSDHQRSKNTS